MSHSVILSIVLLTLKVGLVATVIAAPFAIAIGYGLARYDFWGKAFVESVLLLPLVVPPVATGLLLLYVLKSSLLLTWVAAVFASAIVSLPLFIRSSQQAFLMVPQKLENLALTLGKSRLSIFFQVTIPLAMKGITYGALLFFARCLGEFGATSLVAGDIPGRTETLAIGIYSRIIGGKDEQAWILTGFAVAICFAAVLCANLLLRDRHDGWSERL